MKVAIIDVGSNSVRLLVAAVDAGNVNQIHRERVYLRLGDDAYRRGRIGSRKLEATRGLPPSTRGSRGRRVPSDSRPS